MRDLKIFHAGGEKGKAGCARHYHKYFSGYAEYATEDKNGKKKLRRVYVDSYHRQALSDARWLRLRFAYAALFVGACALFLYSASRHTGGNLARYVAFFSVLSTLALFLLALPMASYLTSRRLMTKYEYHSSAVRLEKLSLAAFVALAAQFLSLAVYILFHIGAETAAELGVLFGYAASAASVSVIYRTERGVVYEEVENAVSAPEESYKL